MTLADSVIKNIIRKLLVGEDYRGEIIEWIDATFLQYAIDFFKRVVEAKLHHEDVTPDWYKAEMLKPEFPKEDIAIHAGLNIKTINNTRNSTRKEVVIEESLKHYDALYRLIQELVSSENMDVTLTIKFRGVSVDLNISESLIVINTLAVKRAEIRGNAWSTAGKKVERPLMRTLCALHRIPKKYFEEVSSPKHSREVDFYLIDGRGKPRRCEVKLMGKGNPESADAVLARDSEVFIADKLSELIKKELNRREVLWVELRGAKNFKQFEQVLEKLKIPFTPFKGDLSKALDKILNRIFNDGEAESTKARAVREEQSEYLVDLPDEV